MRGVETSVQRGSLQCVLHSKYYSENAMKENEMGGHVTHVGEIIGTYRIWWIDLTERDQLEDLGVEGSIIFKWIFKKWDR